MSWIGPAISAVANLAGSAMNSSAIGSSNATSDRAVRRQMEMQKAFAKNGIRWRVEDAKRAGIHPLAAIGANTLSYQPLAVGNIPNTAAGDGLKDLGQDISRAVVATADRKQRELGLTLAEEQVKNIQIQNEMAQLELASAKTRLASGQVGPPMPSSEVNIQPLKKTISPDGRNYQEASFVPDVGFAHTPTGLAPIPSGDVKERIEDQLIPELMWGARNYLGPTLGSMDNKPSKKYLPEGYNDWEWSIKKMEWQPVKKTGRNPGRQFTDWIEKKRLEYGGRPAQERR